MAIEEWRRRARRRLPRFVFDYIDGGADDESSMARNRETLQELRIVPNRLTDVATCDTSVDLFGVRSAAPIAIAPLGFAGLAWPHGDMALADAAAAAGVPFILSTASNSRFRDVARFAGDMWFQVYVLEQRRIVERMLGDAQGAGFRVLVVTVDVPVNGNRLRDQRNGLRLPMSLTPRIALDALAHPRWALDIALHGVPKLINIESDDAGADEAGREALAARKMDRTFAWSHLDWLRSHWNGPLVIKGLLSARDAERAREVGADGIVVSNHGGRQSCHLPSPAEVLEQIAAAVAGRCTVLVDSGFRSGADVVKSIALGAKAALIGRPLLYGLAAAGRRGADDVLRTLQHEIEQTFTLTGFSRCDELSPINVMQRRSSGCSACASMEEAVGGALSRGPAPRNRETTAAPSGPRTSHPCAR